MEKIDISQEARTKVVTLEKGRLHRKLRVAEIFGVGYGDVGSSIIYALGVVAAVALGATPLALAVAGVFFICTALTYAELGATIPEAGGAQIFARRAFNDLVSFIAGWALLLDYVLTAAISAYTIGPYLHQFIPALSLTVVNIAFAGVVMVVLTGINIWGIKESSRISLALAVTAILTLLVLSVWGLITTFSLDLFLTRVKSGLELPWTRLLNAVALSMVAYIGIEAATQLAGEARDPGRTIPRAMKWTVITVLVLYLGITLVATCAVPPEMLGGPFKEFPLIAVAEAAVGNWMKVWVGILAAIVLFVATNAGIVGASRLAYSMSRHLQLPKAFQRLHSKRRTPWISLVFFTAAAVGVLCATQNMQALAELYNFGSMLAFSLAHLSLIGLRIKEPALERPFKTPLNLRIGGKDIPITAIVGGLATFGAWIVVLVLHPTGRNLGFAWLGFGLLLYFLVRRREDIPIVDSVRIERVAMPEFKMLELKQILVPTLGGRTTEVVQIAAQLARDAKAELTALYVIEIPEALPLETFLVEHLQAGDEALARAEAIAREYGVPIRLKLLQARAAGAAICEVAREEKMDLIVIGAPQRPGKVMTLGSTVDAVLRQAPCRVWVCTNAPA